MGREIQTERERESSREEMCMVSLCIARGEGGCGGGSTMPSDFNKGSDSLTSDVIPNKGLSVQREGRAWSRRGSASRSTVSQVWLTYGLPGLGWRGQVREEEELCAGRAGGSRDTRTNTA